MHQNGAAGLWKSNKNCFGSSSHTLPYTYCEQIGKEIRDISDEIPLNTFPGFTISFFD